MFKFQDIIPSFNYYNCNFAICYTINIDHQLIINIEQYIFQ